MILDAPLMVKVYGRPAPKGSLRVVGRGERAHVIEDNANTTAWRDLIRRAGRAWYTAGKLNEPIDGPVAVECTITLDRPESVTPTSRPWPSKKSPGHGDMDNLARLILDGLEDAAVYGNDAQVVDGRPEGVPRHPHALDALDRPGAIVRLYPVPADAPD